MSGTSNNVANFCPDRPISATCFLCVATLLCRYFPNIDVPRTDNNPVSLLLIPTSNVDLHNRPPPTKHTKIIRCFIPLRHVFFTSCRVVTSRCTHFVCLFVRLFVRLVGCCVVSLPLAIASCPIVVEVPCARQSPLTRGRSLRLIVVKVRCARQSPPTRGRSLRPIVVEVRCARQSPPTRGRSLRPIVKKSAEQDKVLQ